MNPFPHKTLTLVTGNMGRILIQPQKFSVAEASEASMLIFPRSLLQPELEYMVEWAAETQLPIFCLAQDIPRLEKEGFGVYRFHVLKTYREVYFQTGTVEFFPAKVYSTRPLFKRLIAGASELFGLRSKAHFHVLIRPRNETPILYLASPGMDAAEWEVLTQSHPGVIFGSDEHTAEEWQEFASQHTQKIMLAAATSLYVNQDAKRDAASADREGPEWTTKSRLAL